MAARGGGGAGGGRHKSLPGAGSGPGGTTRGWRPGPAQQRAQSHRAASPVPPDRAGGGRPGGRPLTKPQVVPSSRRMSYSSSARPCSVWVSSSACWAGTQAGKQLGQANGSTWQAGPASHAVHGGRRRGVRGGRRHAPCAQQAAPTSSMCCDMPCMARSRPPASRSAACFSTASHTAASWCCACRRSCSRGDGVVGWGGVGEVQCECGEWGVGRGVGGGQEVGGWEGHSQAVSHGSARLFTGLPSCCCTCQVQLRSRAATGFWHAGHAQLEGLLLPLLLLATTAASQQWPGCTIWHFRCISGTEIHVANSQARAPGLTCAMRAPCLR